MISESKEIKNIWSKYQKKFAYAEDIPYGKIIQVLKLLLLDNTDKPIKSELSMKALREAQEAMKGEADKRKYIKIISSNCRPRVNTLVECFVLW